MNELESPWLIQNTTSPEGYVIIYASAGKNGFITIAEYVKREVAEYIINLHNENVVE